MKLKKILICLGVVIALSAIGCGGGGGGGTPDEEEEEEQGAAAGEGSPSIMIVTPTGEAGTATSEATVSIAGKATDDVSVSTVTWENEAGGDGDATVSGEDFTISDIALEDGDNEITVTATDGEGNTSTDTILVVYNQYITFSTILNLSQDYLYVDEAADITATIGIEDDTDVTSVELVQVAADGAMTNLKEMTDDGDADSNGDDIIGDNVYSAKVSFNEDAAGTVTLRAKVTSADGTSYSETTALTVMEHLTETELSIITSTPDEAEAQYEDLVTANLSKGLSSKSAAEDAANDLVTWLEETEGVERAGVSSSGNGVWWVYSSGVLGGLVLNADTNETRGGEISKTAHSYLPFKSSKSSIFKDADDAITVGSNRAILLAPYHTQFEGWGGDETDEISTTLTNSACPVYTVDGTYQNANATVELFKTLDDYGVVVITSHGDNWYEGILSWYQDRFGKDEITGVMDWMSQVIILTGTTLTVDNKDDYEADIRKNRLVVTNSQRLAITPAFVRRYNSGMPDSVVYLGSCRSTYNNTMAYAFLAAGAQVVYGYSDYVSSVFAYNHGQDLFDDLVDGTESGSVTGLGEDDGDATPAEFEYRGIDNLTLSLTGIVNGDFEEGTLSGWTASGDYRVLGNFGSLDAYDSLMGLISTGVGTYETEAGVNSDIASEISQTFCVPEDMTTLTFKYDMLSEEPMYYVGTAYNDEFSASLVDGDSVAVDDSPLEVTVNDASWSYFGADYFPGSDDGSEEIGPGNNHDGTFDLGDWQTKSYNVSDYAGTGIPLTLTFHVEDHGDSIYDSGVVLDEVTLE